MRDRRLEALFDDWAETLLPTDELEQSRANAAVVRRDNTVDPSALSTAITLATTLTIAGALTVGTDQSDTLPVLPQRARLRNLYARCRTAPSGGECMVALTANGTEVARVSITAGMTTGVSSLTAIVDAGAALDSDVSVANGAADLTLTLTYSPA